MDKTDREILEEIQRDIAATKQFVEEIRNTVGPIIEDMKNNPMLQMFLK